MCSELVKSASFWGLIGVILGFLLGEGSRYLRYRLRIRNLKCIIRQELKSILVQIPQKEKIVTQIIVKLDEQQILPGVSVGIINTGYKQYIKELYEHLSFLQRNCLHIIYERLDVADKTLFSFEHDFVSVIREKIIDKPFEAYKGRFQDILESYDVVKNLIKGYLDGNPTDVFHEENPGTH